MDERQYNNDYDNPVKVVKVKNSGTAVQKLGISMMIIGTVLGIIIGFILFYMAAQNTYYSQVRDFYIFTGVICIIVIPIKSFIIGYLIEVFGEIAEKYLRNNTEKHIQNGRDYKESFSTEKVKEEKKEIKTNLSPKKNRKKTESGKKLWIVLIILIIVAIVVWGLLFINQPKVIHYSM